MTDSSLPDSTKLTQADSISLKDSTRSFTITDTISDNRQINTTGKIISTSSDLHQNSCKYELGIKIGSSGSGYREEVNELEHSSFSPISIYCALLLKEKHDLQLEAGINERNECKFLTFAFYQKFCNGWKIFQFFGYAGPKLDFLINKNIDKNNEYQSKKSAPFLISFHAGIGMHFLINRLRIGSNVFFENALNKTKIYSDGVSMHSWLLGEELEVGIKFKTGK